MESSRLFPTKQRQASTATSALRDPAIRESSGGSRARVRFEGRRVSQVKADPNRAAALSHLFISLRRLPALIKISTPRQGARRGTGLFAAGQTTETSVRPQSGVGLGRTKVCAGKRRFAVRPLESRFDRARVCTRMRSNLHSLRPGESRSSPEPVCPGGGDREASPATTRGKAGRTSRRLTGPPRTLRSPSTEMRRVSLSAHGEVRLRTFTQRTGPSEEFQNHRHHPTGATPRSRPREKGLLRRCFWNSSDGPVRCVKVRSRTSPCADSDTRRISVLGERRVRGGPVRRRLVRPALPLVVAGLASLSPSPGQTGSGELRLSLS